ncbi:MAG: bacillithiol biosynthesis deacetylase BshB1 [Gemmatimonadales bacterium]|nr:MAG: bacillithiol biosynthesis deacetylase BshB1 [Gemmatimonadales bacterium]
MTEPVDILAVFAHPDDAELLVGGSLAAAVDQGESVGILDLTAGETGSRGTPELREREAAQAARVLGARFRENALLPDGELANTLPMRRRVAGLLRQFRPRIVVTHWLEGRHPDHREAAALVVDASFLAGLRNARDVPGDPHRPFKVVHALTFREQAPNPTFLVDISEQVERRFEAMRCFASQWDGATGAGEVHAGGSRPLEEQVRAQLAHYGSLIRVPYAEPFWTREAVKLPSLGSLAVSTF